jgi:hypothetical protein
MKTAVNNHMLRMLAFTSFAVTVRAKYGYSLLDSITLPFANNQIRTFFYIK